MLSVVLKVFFNDGDILLFLVCYLFVMLELLVELVDVMRIEIWEVVVCDLCMFFFILEKLIMDF